MKLLGYKKYLISFLALGIFLLPNYAKAEIIPIQCSKDGYTVATVNGIFTDEDGAIANMDALRKKLGPTWNTQEIDYQYFLNPSHFDGLGDLAKSVNQKANDFQAVQDYDLIEIFKSASDKVKTQKLLLVAHSQGNFYANSFYDLRAGRVGGVPKKSIGVYGVANPSYRVAGNGKHITSSTDKVIAGWVGGLTLGLIAKPNADIKFTEDSNGHSFSDIYLKYESKRIVEEIQGSLGQLSENTIQPEQQPCISKPDLGLIGDIKQYVTGAFLAVADPIAAGVRDTAVGAYGIAADVTHSAGVIAYDAYDATKTATAKAIASAKANLAALKEIASININSIVTNTKNKSSDIAGFFKNVFAKTDVSPGELAGSISSAIASLDDSNEPTTGASDTSARTVLANKYSDEVLAELAEQLKVKDINPPPGATEAKQIDAVIAQVEAARKKYLAEQTRIIQAKLFQLEMKNVLGAQQTQAAPHIIAYTAEELVRTFLANETALLNNVTAESTATPVVVRTVLATSGEEVPKVRAGRSGHKNPPEESAEVSAEEASEPVEIRDFNVAYDAETLEINFSWDALAGPAIVKIKDGSTGEFIFETALETSFSHRIYEVARDYQYSIGAYDAEGAELVVAEASVYVPNDFINNVSLFSSDRYLQNGMNYNNNFIEFYFDDYPFLPMDLVYNPGGAPGTGPNGKLMVFYFNKDAPQHEFLDSEQPQLEDVPDVISTATMNCASFAAGGLTLEMPDSSDNCPIGGAGSGSINYAAYFDDGDNHLLIPVGRGYAGFIYGFTYTFVPADYFTTAYYGFYRDTYDGAVPLEDKSKMYKLLAVDNTRHYFQSGAPEHEPPTAPGDPEYSLDEPNLLLGVTFDSSTDPDTEDALIRYEISMDGGGTWNVIVSGGQVAVEADTAYEIQLRAADDFNLKSEAVLSEFNVPAVPPQP